MARFTSIGMGKKTFVASAAEDRQTGPKTDAPAPEPKSAEAGPSNSKPKSKPRRGKKRTRDGTAKEKGENTGPNGAEQGGEQSEKPAEAKAAGWGRDKEMAKRAKLNAQLSAERRMKRQNLNTTNTTCFACRSVGHAARDCPNVLLAAQGVGNDGSAALLEGEGEQAGQAGAPKERKGMKRGKGKSGGEVTGGKCYRCDSTSHSLSYCPVKADPSNPTPFATCFICLANGHLSSLCPNNSKGIYVKGGSCKVCGSVKHRASDCPDDKRGKRPEYNEEQDGAVAPVGPMDVGADEDDFMVRSRIEIGNKGKEVKGKKKKHPPNNNGPREKYNKPQQDPDSVNPILAESLVKPDAAPVPVAAAPVIEQPAPAPAPVVKKAKPKIVKF